MLPLRQSSGRCVGTLMAQPVKPSPIGVSLADDLDPKTIAGLLGLFAHDLRNPLSALHSNVGFLSSSLVDADSDTEEALRDALVSCDGLVTLIDNLELFSQALVGPQVRNQEIVGLAGVVTEVVAQHQGIALSHETSLTVHDSAANSQVAVRVHRDMYRRALSNLIRNGIQHSAAGPVMVRAEVRGSEAAVLVADFGPRLPEELMDSAFSAEGQLAVKGRSAGRYGRGLGLFCARYAAEASGARISVEAPPAGYGNVLVLSAPQAR